jgi:CRISPR-associated protein Cmr2
MSDQKRYLFLYTIGPVQSFIASARKTRDLWAGSYLLSYLVKTGLDFINKEGVTDKDVIFPDPDAASGALDMALLPNRFLTMVPEKTDVKTLADWVTNEIQAKFNGIIKFGIKKFGSSTGIENFSNRQVQDFLETYWVAIPFNKSCSYAEQYEAIETALCGRKNLKTFEQPDQPEGSLKCSMCGEREAAHPKEVTEIHAVKKFWEKISLGNPQFSDREYLCFICLAKRFLPDYFKEKTRFPSTAEVAAAAYKGIIFGSSEYWNLERIAGARNMLGRQGWHLPKNRKQFGVGETLDAMWLYKENYTLKRFQSQNKDLTEDNVKALSGDAKKREGNNKPLDVLQKRFGKPIPYYAVLAMDADDMGKRIKAVESIEAHKNISSALAEFAKNDARKIVEEDHLGKLIYSGGDDILALVNIDHLFCVMEELRRRFSDRFNKDFNELGRFSLSCGVCISHYKNPFSTTLRTANEMVKLAKTDEEFLTHPRNAFAIMVLSHSGNLKKAAANWEPGESDTPTLIDELQEVKFLLDKKVLSNNFIYTLKKEFAPLMDQKGKINNDVFLLSELQRLMWRAVDRKNLEESGKTGEDIMKIGANLRSFFDSMNYNLANFISLLEITNFISREETTS